MIKVKKLTYDTKTKCYVTIGRPLFFSKERLTENYSEIAFGPEGEDWQKVVDGPGPNLIRVQSASTSIQCQHTLRNDDGYDVRCNGDAVYMVDRGSPHQYPMCKTCARKTRVHSSRLTLV